ncbi:IS1-like element transposase [Fischerella muscicola]|uniref:IS1/IS1595 family N-terminal zinc-binding domain-containing protein n=1 Tax=Fischerella muscicola TaxID=92938 RepID=UPI0002E6D4A5|nr:transposase [Fischerella muscicola]
MILIPIRCPHCQNANICRNGRTSTGKQRYICKNPECPYKTFTLEAHPYYGSRKEVKEKITAMAVNGSGITDTARTLKISPVTVLSELKKTKKNRKCESKVTSSA